MNTSSITYPTHPTQTYAASLVRAALTFGYRITVKDNTTGAIVLRHQDCAAPLPQAVAAAVRTYESVRVVITGHRREMVATVNFVKYGTRVGVEYGQEVERLAGIAEELADVAFGISR